MGSHGTWLRRVVGVGLWSAAVVAAEPANLLPDGGFERPKSDTGLPAGAGTFKAQDATLIEAKVVPDGRTGQALRIEGQGAYVGVGLNRLPVEPNRQLALRGWVKVEGDENTRAVVKFDYLRADRSYLASAPGEPVTPKQSGWQLVALTARPDTVADAAIVCAVVAVEGGGRAWFDDLEMASRPAAPAVGNLVENGDFERVAAGQPAKFGVSWQPREEPVTMACSDDHPRSGWYCLHLAGNVNYAVAYGLSLPTEPGKRYVLKGFARSSKGGCRIKLDYTRDGQFVGQTVSPRITGMEWQEQTVVSEIERFPDANRVAATAVIEGDSEAWFDDFVLTRE